MFCIPFFTLTVLFPCDKRNDIYFARDEFLNLITGNRIFRYIRTFNALHGAIQTLTEENCLAIINLSGKETQPIFFLFLNFQNVKSEN